MKTHKSCDWFISRNRLPGAWRSSTIASQNSPNEVILMFCIHTSPHSKKTPKCVCSHVGEGLPFSRQWWCTAMLLGITRHESRKDILCRITALITHSSCNFIFFWTFWKYCSSSVQICIGKPAIVGLDAGWALVSEPEQMWVGDLPRNLWLCESLHRTGPPAPWPPASLWRLRSSRMLRSPWLTQK